MISTKLSRPKLEYNTLIWSPYLKNDAIKIESAQRNFTRSVCNKCNISYTSYKNRLVKLGLEFLEYRKWQFDLITLLKIVNGKYEEFFNQFLVFSQTDYNLREND